MAMEFEVEPLGPCRKRVAVTIPPERVREEYDRQFDEINEKVVMPGFRRGRAPRKVLERRFAGALARDVKEKLVQSALEQLSEDKQVDALEPPSIDLEALELEAEKPFRFEFEVLVKPEFETPEYKGLEVKVPAVEVSAQDVDRAVEGLRQRGARLQALEEEKAAEGDVVVVDWEAKDGDSVVAHDEGVYYRLGRGVVAGFVAEGLDAQLEGARPGTTATAQVQVGADDPREELHGRELQLGLTVKEVKRMVLPEVDEEFLKRHDYDDVEEMREDVERRIRRARLQERDREAEERLVGELVGRIEMSLPEEFVDRELQAWARRKRTSLQMEGVEEDEITRRLDEGRQHAQEHIEQDLRRYFVLERIAEKEEVNVVEAEIHQAIQEIADAYGRPVEEVLSSFRDPGRLTELVGQIKHRKVREIIRRAATLVEEAPAAEAADEPEKPAPKPGKKKAPRRGE